MPSTPSANLRLNLQETGEGLNTWGLRLNESLVLIEQAITGIFTKALTGNYTLSVALYDEDEARNAALIFTDGGLSAAPTVTLPNVSKIYYVENRGLAYGITFTAGGATGVLPAGRRGLVLCNGSTVWVFDPVALADNARIAAEEARDLSEDWATLLGSVVADGEFSAKEYAVGTTSTAGSSKEWATTTGAAVAGGEYAAKEYALGDLTATGGSAKAWATDSASPNGTTDKSAKTLAGEAATAASNAGSSASSAAGFASAASGYADDAAESATAAAASAASVDGPALTASVLAARRFAYAINLHLGA